MVTDQQVRRMRMLIETGPTLAVVAAKAGMNEQTARKYRRLGKLPSELARAHQWRTRPDPFEGTWDWCRGQLELEPGLQAKTLFEALQREDPGRFADGQLRTLQRRVKVWRATEGPGKEVFFTQVHRPGALCESDFSDLTGLGVTIQGRRFEHLVYHFVLTYSNWEWFTVCFSESFESLSEGLQEALWKLGAVPATHRTDRLSAAVNNLPKGRSPDGPLQSPAADGGAMAGGAGLSRESGDPAGQGCSEVGEAPPETARAAFTRRYEALLSHYGLAGQKIQAGQANQNGDVEQRHHRFKEVVDQALMLRGSRDFESREAYEAFLRELAERLDAGRRERLAEELAVMRPLPQRRLEACKQLQKIGVDRGSLIHVERNVYSVSSRLIGEEVDVRLYAERLEVWYGQKKVEDLPRLRGRNKRRIDYRHVIDWLVRKPGAFENYCYREEMFPTSRFRMAYDALRERSASTAAREYLEILYLAARESETLVDQILDRLLQADQELTATAVRRLVVAGTRMAPVPEVTVAAVDVSVFDALYCEGRAA